MNVVDLEKENRDLKDQLTQFEEMLEGMKEGVTIRIQVLEAELAKEKAANALLTEQNNQLREYVKQEKMINKLMGEAWDQH